MGEGDRNGLTKRSSVFRVVYKQFNKCLCVSRMKSGQSKLGLSK